MHEGGGREEGGGVFSDAEGKSVTCVGCTSGYIRLCWGPGLSHSLESEAES